MNGLKSRIVVIGFGCALVFIFLAYAFWPRALIVDLGSVNRGVMAVTIDEEAKTRVRETYVVSAPNTGRLLRIDAEPGDPVSKDETVIARLLPTYPAMLDARTEEQAAANVEAAEAALALANAEVKKAAADADYAKVELQRTQKLHETDAVSDAALDRTERAWRVARASQETAIAAVAMRKADLENARAMLMTFSEAQRIATETNPHPREAILIKAPISGCVLRVMQESETIIPAGAPILEIGDPSGDLEIIAELLSTDAVKASPGDRVIIEKWGGGDALDGVVERIEPWGFTKFSALGVEEQRVNVIIRFTGSPETHQKLGHGYRTEIKIVTWENDNALKALSSAIFRTGKDWAVFKVVNGRARLTIVDIGQNNGVEAEILSGLNEGDEIVLYPGNQVSDGGRVKQRAIAG